MGAIQICSEAIEKNNEKITNEIFLIIQNDRDLMLKYLRAVESDGLDVVNRTIGKEVKKHYNLTSMVGFREENPSSTLIQNHQIFE